MAQIGNCHSVIFWDGFRKRTKSELRDFIVKLLARVDVLELQLAKANKDSSNSSKSPSSDITEAVKKKKKPGRPRKRKAGGQPGHERNLREALPPERVDEIIEYEIADSEIARLQLTPTDQFERFSISNCRTRR